MKLLSMMNRCSHKRLSTPSGFFCAWFDFFFTHSRSLYLLSIAYFPKSPTPNRGISIYTCIIKMVTLSRLLLLALSPS